MSAVRNEILSALNAAPNALTSSVIAANIGRPAPSVRRTLSQLEREGAVRVILPAVGPLTYSTEPAVIRDATL